MSRPVAPPVANVFRPSLREFHAAYKAAKAARQASGPTAAPPPARGTEKGRE